MKYARDIMTARLTQVSPSDSIQKAMGTLLENNISGAPVVDRTGKMIGFVSEYDLILASYALGWGADLEKAMKRDVYSAKPTTPIEEIADIMITRKIKRVPVLDENHKPVGVVSRREILLHLHEESKKASGHP